MNGLMTQFLMGGIQEEGTFCLLGENWGEGS